MSVEEKRESHAPSALSRSTLRPSHRVNTETAEACVARLFGLFLLCAPWPATGEDARSEPVRVYAPAAGASLDAKTRQRLEYEIKPGTGGHHIHVYVDDIEVAILRQLKGSYLLPGLEPGRREICVKVVNAKHVPIGIESCIHVMVR